MGDCNRNFIIGVGVLIKYSGLNTHMNIKYTLNNDDLTFEEVIRILENNALNKIVDPLKEVKGFKLFCNQYFTKIKS